MLRRRSPRLKYLRGGVKLGEGSTSWIIEPALPCGPHDGHEIVSKLFYYGTLPSENGEFNKKLVDLLKKTDPFQERFIYPLSYCDESKHETLSEDQKDAVFQVTHIRPDSTKDLTYFNMPKAYPADFPLTLPQAHYVRESLDILHQVGIVHGDLHRHNIMIGLDAKPRIIDFGMSSMSVNKKKRGNDLTMLQRAIEAPQSVKKRKKHSLDNDDDESGMSPSTGGRGRTLAFD